MYHVLQHNGEFKWDLIYATPSLDSALDYIRYEMSKWGGQFTIREVEE